MTSNTRTRASDADRDRIVAALREHLAAGRLTIEEFDERMDKAYAAKTLGELDSLMTDLPETGPGQLPDAPPARPASSPPLTRRRRPGSIEAGRGRFSPAWRTTGGPWLAISLVLFVIWLADLARDIAIIKARLEGPAKPRPPGSDPSARGSQAGLRAIKAIHTLAWFSIEGCMVYVLYAGFAGRSDRRAGIAAAVVAAETLIFAGNGFRCPLTQVAERLGAERGSVTDIYLPRWFARSLPAIHVPLIGLAGFLHARNLRTRR